MWTFTLIMEHKAFLSTWCRTFLHTREKEVFFLNTLKISLAPTHPRTTSSGDVCGGLSRQGSMRELNTRERKGQDATKITSAFADSCIQFLWSVMPIPMTALTGMVKNTSNRNAIDEAGFVRQYNFFHLLIRMLCLCLALMIFLLGVAPFLLAFVTTAVSIPHWVVKSDRLSQDEDRLREDYYYEALAFSRHSINVELDEDIMKPEKATEAPRYSGIPCSAANCL